MARFLLGQSKCGIGCIAFHCNHTIYNSILYYNLIFCMSTPSVSAPPALPLQSIANVTLTPSEWHSHSTLTPSSRPSSATVSLMDPNQQQGMRQLPVECGGMKGLIMPNYLSGEISSVMLPSRLEELGRNSLPTLGVFRL